MLCIRKDSVQTSKNHKRDKCRAQHTLDQGPLGLECWCSDSLQSIPTLHVDSAWARPTTWIDDIGAMALQGLE